MKPNSDLFLKGKYSEYTRKSEYGLSSPKTSVNKYVVLGKLLKSQLNLCKSQFPHL